MKLGKGIRSARKRAGLTKTELATALNVTCQTICGWEKGTHGVRTGRLDAIAQILGVTVPELF